MTVSLPTKKIKKSLSLKILLKNSAGISNCWLMKLKIGRGMSVRWRISSPILKTHSTHKSWTLRNKMPNLILNSSNLRNSSLHTKRTMVISTSLFNKISLLKNLPSPKDFQHNPRTKTVSTLLKPIKSTAQTVTTTLSTSSHTKPMMSAAFPAETRPT
jgi:hypothetical protein